MPQALEGDCLDRGAVGVGVDPDLAREHAVGPGDGVLAHVHDLGARVAVGKVAQALLYLRGSRPRAGLERGVDEPQVGELLGELRLDPALLDLELHQPSALALRRSSSSVRLPSSVSTTLPPALAKMVVGQPPTP